MNLTINQIYKGEIFDQENSGLGVAKIHGFIVFVKDGLKGDIGDILITEIKKGYARGTLIKLDKLSTERINPTCSYYKDCGGCQLQHQSYKDQLIFKQNKIIKALEHIGKIKDVKIEQIIPTNEYNYRNKVVLKVKDNNIGFYSHNTNNIVDIKECKISKPIINEVITLLRAFIYNKEHNIDSVVIRTSTYSNEVMINIISNSFKLEQALIKHMTSNIKNISIFLNNNLIYGNEYITEELNELLFKISPLSFFQINKDQSLNLYNKVVEYADLSKDDNALDLYCGTGTITSFLAKECNKVIGIEIESSSIEDAKNNLLINKINNVKFIQGKVESCLTELLNNKIDVIVIDPPRKGSDELTLSTMVKINPTKIIYVSCNPVTLARDLKYLLSNNYIIESISPFDMFPQTEHVECVVKLCLKNTEK
ncbi:MAG: 23S rRNA (uracil(1939)-C(5))-methyltransferase RlmD [Bacilli bacterium]|nr:23S rRNA (uracil(1939)-C(5))-methyltransferase RlmD [Bacilli bacterium]